MSSLRHCLLILTLTTTATTVHSQQTPIRFPPEIHVCPGAFPTDLTQTIDCRYSSKQRALALAGSVTDQAVLSAAIFAMGAQIIKSPSEWGRTWDGYGRRVGSRYTQAVGKGSAEYLFGQILRDDPRFLAYRNDPGVIKKHQAAVCTLVARQSPNVLIWPCSNHSSTQNLNALTHDGWQRFGHAWFDVITVRRSTTSGDGERIPAISRFAGEFGGAYAGYPGYPAAENRFPQVGERAAGAFGTAVLQSFYTEYKPEITNLLGAIFRRGAQPKPTTGGQP